MPDIFHVDMSGKIERLEYISVACINARTKEHNGCIVRPSMLRDIGKRLCKGSLKDLPIQRAKLYAILTYILIENNTSQVQRLIICWDEDFYHVKAYLIALLNKIGLNIDIVSIRELRMISGAHIRSLADNRSRSYRRRGMNRCRHGKGANLNVVHISYDEIKNLWNSLD